MKKKFEEIIKEYALDFAAKNAIVEYGEIVDTLWYGWKNPHKVKITTIGAGLSLNNWEIINGQRNHTNTGLIPKFGMFYYAKRLKSDGSIKFEGDSGIVLTNFKKANGMIWEETHELINHSWYSWVLPGK